MRGERRLAACIAIATLLATTDVAAAGFARPYWGGEHANVTETNPTTLYFNPGGMGMSRGDHVVADYSFTFRRATWQHPVAPTDTPDPEGANHGRAVAFNMMSGPMAGATFAHGSWAIGIAFTVPFVTRTEWDENARFEGSRSAPGADKGAARWHAIETNLGVAYLTAGAAYRLGRVSAGIAANAVRSDYYINRAITDRGDDDVTREGRWALDTGGWNGSFGAGVLVEAIEQRLYVGASYQARPGLGPMRLEGTLQTTAAGGPTLSRDAYLEQSLPDIVRFGIRLRASRQIELRLVGDLTRWSAMQRQCVALVGSGCGVGAPGTLAVLDRRWMDTAGLAAGASYWAGEDVEVLGGVGAESYASPDATLDPSLRDGATVRFTGGVRVQATPELTVQPSLTFLPMLPRDNVGRSDLRPDAGGVLTQWSLVSNINLELLL